MSSAARRFRQRSCALRSWPDRKREITDKDVMALLREQRLHRDAGMQLFSFQIFSGNKMTSTATVTLEKDGETKTRAACGDGPVEACFNARGRHHRHAPAPWKATT